MTRYTFNMDTPYANARGILSVSVAAADITDACDRLVEFTEDESVLLAVTSVTCDIDVSEEARKRAREQEGGH